MTNPVIIGDAVLYLGDCREILPTLGRVDAVVTDPPYGVDLGNHSGAAENRKGLLRKVGGYLDTEEYFNDTVPPVVRDCLAIAERGAVFGVPPNIWKLPPPDALGGIFIPGAVGRNKWGWSNLIHCALYGTAAQLNLGAKRTAISSGDVAPVTGHPTTKPTNWMVWCVDLASSRGETVIDPFMGSGTTGVACAKLGRKFIGIEIEPKYFDIACRRIEAAYAQPDMFITPPAKPVQEALI
jgi:DNA modification methylase